MGAIGGSIWHGVKGFRNSPHVLPLLAGSLLMVGRAIHWIDYLHKGSCTGSGREFWSLGWIIQYLRLCREKYPTERRSMEVKAFLELQYLGQC